MAWGHFLIMSLHFRWWVLHMTVALFILESRWYSSGKNLEHQYLWNFDVTMISTLLSYYMYDMMMYRIYLIIFLVLAAIISPYPQLNYWICIIGICPNDLASDDSIMVWNYTRLMSAHKKVEQTSKNFQESGLRLRNDYTPKDKLAHWTGKTR